MFSKFKFFVFCLIAIACVIGALDASAMRRDLQYKVEYKLEDVFPQAASFNEIGGTPPAAKAFDESGKHIGYVYITYQVVSSIGYSGKPIKTLVGINLNGDVVGARVIEHYEPILLAGISKSSFDRFVSQHVGLNVLGKPAKVHKSDIELISGATVTAMVVNDTIIKAGRKILRQATSQEKDPLRPLDKSLVLDDVTWESLVGDGTIRRLRLSPEDVNATFAEMGVLEDRYNEIEYLPGQDFIDLYIGLLSIPTVYKNLLNEDEQNWLQENVFSKGEQAIFIAANGAFSFRGSGFVRGGIFDRILVEQDGNSFRFRDRDYKRIGAFDMEGAPEFNEIGIFSIPQTENKATNFKTTADWSLDLLVSRHISALDKVFKSFDVTYSVPDQYLVPKPKPVSKVATSGSVEQHDIPAAEIDEDEAPLWLTIWQNSVFDIIVLGIALFALTLTFFMQDRLVHYPRFVEYFRTGFLIFTVVWIGFYAQAQLSVVNVLTFTSSLIHGFSWDFFLMEPKIFILWCAVAVGLLFWGRGVYCGWLCPFGALQELVNKLARWLSIPQVKMPWGLHERAWAIKYIIFLSLFGVSLSSLALAELAAEVEPFKTTFLLKFAREWPFVLYAVILLGIGVFIERFFCRYLCPLGAALAIPANNRLFRWLKRRHQCGVECGRCASRCMVKAIHPTGEINPNECLYCLGCQVIYYDENTCLPLIMQRKKREDRIKNAAVVAKSKAGKAKPKASKKTTKVVIKD